MTGQAGATDGPLAGLTVIDLSRLLPGPAATMHLADFGATVIKVEDTGEGDYMRGFPPQAGIGSGAAINPAFEAVNRGKQSICIDLKSDAGRAVLLRLVDRADALLESFRPGVLGRLGLGWETLHARNARLVVCSLSGYGQGGPLAHTAGHDLNYCALAGVLDQNRAAGMPAIANLQMGDLLGGALAALSAMLIALLAAQRSGVGRHLDVAMTDGLLAHHFFAHADLDAGSAPVAERTLLTGGVACYRVYRTSDGAWLAVGALELKFWQTFCATAGLSELNHRHWSLGELPGSAAAQQTIGLVAARIAQRTREEWAAAFAAVDACTTPVLTPAEALALPQFAARGLVHRAGAITHIGPLAQMNDHRLQIRPAPRAGQHTVGLLRDLGFEAPAIEQLLASGAVRAS